jgi:hypothetical protein
MILRELETFNDEYIIDVRDAIEEIVNIYQDHNFFWKNASGWAPQEADVILSKSRLDWLHSLSEALYIWTETYRTTTDNDGKLILAWANLGALLEGGLKLFLSIYFLDYKNSSNHKKDRQGNLKDPDMLQLEELKVFILKEKIFDKKWNDFISLVQKRRNAIHAYKDREIGNWDEFFNSVIKLCEFTKIIKERLPYPY